VTASRQVWGRDAELAFVRQHLDRCGTVVLTAPAGLGRSTVAAAAVSERVVRAGQALPAWRNRPLQPWLSAYGVPGRSPTSADLAETVRTSTGQFEVVLLEDLQWADDRTCDLVVELTGAVPILCTVQVADGERSEVVERLRTGGADVVELAPLTIEATAAVVRAANPALAEGEIFRLAGLAGGRPLLARILACCADLVDDALVGEDGAALAALIGHQPAAARRSLLALGLAGRPLPVDRLAEVPGLRRAGLVMETGDGRVEPVHRLVTDRHLLGLTPADEIELHRALADLSRGDPVRRARHLLGAGEPEAAMSEARAAAAGPLERSEQADALQVAASAARRLLAAGSRCREDLDVVLVDAARALNDAARFDEADELLSGLVVAESDTSTPMVVELLRAAVGRGDRTRVGELAALADARLAGGAPAEDLGRLRVLRGLLDPWAVGPSPPGEHLRSVAAEQLSSATDGATRSEAAMAVGLATYVDGADAALDWFEVAREEAVSSGAIASEFDATRNLVMVLTAVGRHAEAQELADAAAQKAAELGERSWSLEFQTYGMVSRSYEQPDQDGLVSWMSYVRTAPVRLAVRAMAVNALSVLLADRGAVQRSEQVLSPWLRAERLESMEPLCQGMISWAGVQRAWIVGDLEQAVHLARWATRTIPAGYPSLAGTQVVWRWAEYELGRTITAPDPVGGLLPCASLEAAAIAALVAGDPLAAADGFEQAAASWSSILPRCALRARWGAGHSLVIAGHTDAAVACLQRLDDELDEAWMPALRPRVRASLRLASGGRAGPEPRVRSGQLLSEREHQVMLLVVEGMTSNEIARRLGLAPATVDSHVRSARRKLGARTRIEAAAMVGLAG
jgi:DNA-binding CsgD family transcriptional regulator